jgi:uncharacterized protein (TIGR02677 family)
VTEEATGRGSFQPFAHVTAEKVDLYRAVMGAFVRAKQRFGVHLRPEDVHDTLKAEAATTDLAEVTDALNKLVFWGNLRADPDTSRVTTVEDFLRSRFLYQLTHEGEAVEAALATYDEALGRRGELQAVALADIRDLLLALRALADEPEPDAAKVHQLLRDLVTVFRGLADNAQAFMGSLQRTIDLHDADVEAFLAYKERLIDYLQRFVQDLVVASAQIATTLHELEQRDVGRLLRLVAEREARDAAPGGVDEAAATDALTDKLAPWLDRWAGLRHWFVGDRERPSQARLLRDHARAAVPALLSVATALNERRSGRSDRSADFRTLARWFAEAPSEADLHRLWRTAFGLAPARHLTVDPDTLAARAEHPVPPSTSWAEAAPILVSPRLRHTGRYERRGRLPEIVDRAMHRRLIAERVAEEAAQLEAARRRLATGRPTRLSEIGELDELSFGLFLRLLGDALSRRVPGERTVRVQSGDGSLTVALTATGDGAVARIPTSGGVFTGPDYTVEIHDASTAAHIDEQADEEVA